MVTAVDAIPERNARLRVGPALVEPRRQRLAHPRVALRKLGRTVLESNERAEPPKSRLRFSCGIGTVGSCYIPSKSPT